MPVITKPYGMLETNAYLVHNDLDAVVVDPPEDPEQLVQIIKDRKLTLRAVLVSHLHFDHVGGCPDWCRLYNMPALVGRVELENLDILEGMGRRFGFQELLTYPHQALEEGETSFGSLKCEVSLTPGHSPGSLSFYFPEEKALCCGDLLFKGSVGRSDFPGGNFEELCTSLRNKVYVLPPETTVYPGHGQQTTVGAEAAGNPFCKADG